MGEQCVLWFNWNTAIRINLSGAAIASARCRILMVLERGRGASIKGKSWRKRRIGCFKKPRSLRNDPMFTIQLIHPW
jgi:hypothetical protein